MPLSLANADEGTPVLYQSAISAQDKVIPAAIQKFIQNIKETVDLKNIFEIFNDDSQCVKYDEKGRISGVHLKDGTQIGYSYVYDKDGKLAMISLTSNDGMFLEFRAVEDKKDKQNSSPDLPQDNGEPRGGIRTNRCEDSLCGDRDRPITSIVDDTQKPPEPIEPVKKPEDKPEIIVYLPQYALPQIARKPIDFDKIKDGFDKALKEKNKAYEEYMKKTTPYYEKILNELAASAGGLKAEGVKVDINVKDKKPDGSIDARQRKSVDEAVQDIRRRAEEGRGEARQAERFIAVEKILSDEFLNPNRQIFEDKVKKAVDYVNKIIDAVIKSKLAVYLNVDKDKIETIVNLPEAKK
ncbi:MAG: hypothetical protein V1927_06240 [Candidatus Omnitrophota bacterium]